MFVTLYIDDILIFETNLNVIKEVKDFLSNNFEMKDLGVANVILNTMLFRITCLVCYNLLAITILCLAKFKNN